MAEEPKLVMHCSICYSTKFQLSRVRPGDRLQILFFKYPVRCRKCNARAYASRAYAAYLRKLGKESPMQGHEEVEAE